MAPLRVTFADVYPHVYGGSHHVILLQAKELQRRGMRVEVLETGRGPFTARLAAEGVPSGVVELPPALGHYGGGTSGRRALRAVAALPRFWWQLSRRLRRTTDVVHVGSQRGILLVGPAARLAGVGLVWQVHGLRPPQVVNAVGRILAHRTLAVSPDTAAGLPRVPGRPAPVVVPNAVPDAAFDVAPAPARPPVVLTAARIYPDKGLDVLVAAMQLVRRERHDVVARIAGDVPAGHEAHRSDLGQQVVGRGLTGAVEFLGHVDDLTDRFSTAAVYVQPSRREGFGVATLEAMAAAVPVVVSDVDGLALLVDDGVTGLRVPPEDPVALARAILGVLDDPETAEKMARAAQQVARDHYRIEASVDLVEAAYSEITDRRRRAS